MLTGANVRQSSLLGRNLEHAAGTHIHFDLKVLTEVCS